MREHYDAHGDLHIDVDCDCHGCMLRVYRDLDDFPEGPFFDLSFWKHVGSYVSFRNRFRAAWRMLRWGHGYEEIVICRETAENFAKALLRACKKEENASVGG